MAKAIKKPRTGARPPSEPRKKQVRVGNWIRILRWGTSFLLLALFFSLASYPARRVVLGWFGQNSDFKKLPLIYSVDGIPALWGYSGWGGPANHLAENRSEAPVIDHNCYDGNLNINGTAFSHGVGVHAPSKIAFDLGGKANRFFCQTGLDASSDERQSQGVFCYVLADGREILRSPRLTVNSNPFNIDVSVQGVQELVLGADTTDLEDVGSDVDWVNLKFIH